MYQPEHLKTKELISIKPSRELNFLPINKRYVSTLSIYNKTDLPVILRIKTTAARSYVVNPHTDIILPKRNSEIKFIMPYIDKIKERSEDKFLIQAIAYDEPDTSLDQEAMYNAFVELSKKVPSKEIQSFKLKVHFEIYTAIEEEMSNQATPLKTPFFPFFDPNKDEEISELNIDGIEKVVDEERVKTKKRFDFKAQTVSPKSIFSKEEKRSSETAVTLQEVGNINNENNSHTEPKRRLVFKVKKNSTLIPDLTSKSPRIRQENRTPERVTRDLFSNFEMAAERSRDGLSPFTSPSRSLVGGDNNISQVNMSMTMRSDINGVRSPMNDAKRMLIYKSKYEALKDKWQFQQNQLSKLKEEKNEYLEEMNKTRVMIGTETNIGGAGGENTTATAKENKKKPVEIWQMLMISVIFLIIGSLFRGNNK